MIEIETLLYYRFTLSQEQVQELNDLLTHSLEVCGNCPNSTISFNKNTSSLYRLMDELQRHLP